jgi:hypothetical protein
MPTMPAASAAPAPDLPKAYDAAELVALATFPTGLAGAASELLETHRTLPREVRYVADVQKWMLSHSTMALHFENRLDPTRPPITPSNLLRFFGDTPVASKNTVLAFLMEMRQYRFVESVQTKDRRRRVLKVTESTEQLMRFYFDIHLRGLDAMDGGARMAISTGEPTMFHIAQPLFARLLLQGQGWWSPPPIIASFVRSDSGNSVIHDLVSKVKDTDLGSEPIWIGSVSATGIAKHYLVSQTHTVRLFSRARAQGLIGWKQKVNRGECWVSPDLVRAYRFWQATKFSAISQGVQEACRILKLA